ncbi:MAG: NAD(P)/FAD-dependent oxidoreductase [Bacteroidetes bacterium]|nr:NAD(P)/FAD-dependent oxidoreductase [Bacteroidota bacterium]
MKKREENDPFDVIITGSGMGGLMCGAILSHNGFRVCVLEKHHQIGGNLQTFKRKGVVFNSAMHFVGTMEKGQILHQVFKYLGVLDSTGLERLDPDHYERIYMGGKEYSYAMGMKGYRERLLSYFPAEQAAIDAYLEKIEEVWNSTNVLNLHDFRNHLDADTQYTQIDAFEFIDGLTDNKELRALWGMTSALYAGEPGRSPLITHAIIHYHYIQSAWKFSRGSDHLAGALEKVIRENGGEVRRNSEVVKFVTDGRSATAVELKDGSLLGGKHFISNLHPSQTVKLVEPGLFRKAYVHRIEDLENTIGSFCLYIKLKKGVFKNINSNVFITSEKSVWHPGEYYKRSWPGACILYTSPDSSDPEYAESMTISSYMKYEEVKEWEGTGVGKRGKRYSAFKHERAGLLIKLVESCLEGLEEAIDTYFSATPLTFRDYTGTPEGTVYGIMKDSRNPRHSYISPNTRIPNLYLTGQNSGVGLHGVLGVTVSALFTCANLLDIGELLNEIRNDKE